MTWINRRSNQFSDQSRNHSKETAVRKIFNDITSTIDSRRLSVLCLYDLSEAFDTVDYDILLSRFETTYGFTSYALQWLRSYLSNRAFSEQFGDSCSTSVWLQCEKRQGSVLEPLLFILYKAQLEDVAKEHGCNCRRQSAIRSLPPQRCRSDG